MNTLIPIFGRNPCPETGPLRITGAVLRSMAHNYGVPHGSVLVAIVAARRTDSGVAVPHILLHRRSPHKKVCPGLWDICGGHVEINDEMLRTRGLWSDAQYIEDLFATAAVREADEECTIISQRVKSNFRFGKAHMRQFGPTGAFEYGFDVPEATNREFASLHFAFVPPDVLTLEKSEQAHHAFRVKDSVPGSQGAREFVSLDLYMLPLDKLIERFREDPTRYADGIARVLSRCLQDPTTMKAIEEFLLSGGA